MKNTYLFTLFLTFLQFSTYATVYTAVATGDWTDGSTWGTLSYPSVGDSVYIDGHIITADLSDITTQYIIITNKDNGGASKLIVDSSVTLTVTGAVDIISEDSAHEVKIELLSNSKLEVGESINVLRTVDNTKNGKIELKVIDNASLIISQNLNFAINNASSTKGDSKINVHGFGVLEIGGQMMVNIKGGDKFELHTHDDAKVITKGNFVIHKDGGQEVYLHINSDSLTSVAGNMTLQHYGGTGPFLMKVGDNNGSLNVGGHLTLESNSPDLLVTNELHGANTIQEVAGDIVLIAQSEDDVLINTTANSHLKIGGSFSRIDYGKLVMDAETSLTYNGTGAQTIASNKLSGTMSEEFVFANIFFDNLSGVPFTLEDTLIIEDALHLTNGIIQATEDRPIIIEDYATVVGGSEIAYIEGPVFKLGRSSGSFIFPLGHQNFYSPLELTEITNANSSYRVEYINCPPPIGSYGLGIEQVSNQEYWDFEWTSGSTVVGITLHWADAFASGIDNTDSLIVVYNHGTNGWLSMSNDGVTTGPGTRGTISSNSINCPPPIGSMSLTFGSTDSYVNSLPLELTHFEVYAEAKKIAALEWETIAELAFSHFEVERSSNGVEFHQTAIVQGTGVALDQGQTYRTLDHYPLPGINYYRLKMMDKDESYVYSPIKSVQFSTDNDLFLSPNPAIDEITISGLDLNSTEGRVEIYNSAAQLIYQNQHDMESGTMRLSLEQLNVKISGNYYLRVIDDTRRRRTIYFIKQD